MNGVGGGVLSEAREWWLGLSNGKRTVAIAFLLAPLFLLLWREGRYLTLLVLGVPGLWFGFRIGFLRFIDREARILLLLIAVFLGVGLIGWAVGGFTEEGLQRFDRHNRLILFLPWLISLIWLQPPPRLIWLMLAISGFVVATAGLIEVWQAGQGLSHRVEGDAHAMSFALSCTLLAAVLAGGAWQFRRSPLFAVFLLLAAVAATLAMLMTGVRAGVLGLILAFMTLAICFGAFRDRLGLLAFLVAPLGVMLLIVTFTADGMKERMGQGVGQVQEYLSVEAAMPPRSEARSGCQDDPRLLSATLKADAVLQRRVERLEVVTGEEGAACGSGARYRIEAGSKRAATVRLPRQYLLDADDLDAVVHARGEGARMTLRDSEPRDVSAETARLVLPSARAHQDHLEVSLKPGGWVEFTPDAQWPGEYRYPHVVRSMNQRMEMWRVALAAFAQRPLLGHGTGSFNEIAREWVNQGHAAPVLLRYDHAHSEYMDALATRGVLGFITLVLLLICLVWVSYRRPSIPSEKVDASKDHRGGIPFAAAWVALSGIFLTEASLSMNLNAISIALFLAIALYLAHRGREPEDWQYNRLSFRKQKD